MEIDKIDINDFFRYISKEYPQEFYLAYCAFMSSRSSLSRVSDGLPFPITADDSSDIEVKVASSRGESVTNFECDTTRPSCTTREDSGCMIVQSKSAKRKALKAPSRPLSPKWVFKPTSRTPPSLARSSSPDSTRKIAPSAPLSSAVNSLPSPRLASSKRRELCSSTAEGFNHLDHKIPPPLFIRNKAKWETVSSLMSEQKLQFMSARSTPVGIRVQTATSSDHRGLIQLLRDRGYEYHTYALEDERHLTVVIRGLPVDISTDRILVDLKSQSLPVLSVHRMFRAKTKIPLELVLVHLELSDEGKKIFNIRVVNNLSGLRVEILRDRQVSEQCHRCQLYGHYQRFCYARPRCVKYLDDHAAANCPSKGFENSPSCVLCQQKGHTANYRGCPKAPRKTQLVIRPSCHV